MSRITRWKPEKTKTKIVFRLQFHATHIPQSGWDKLFVSFIPADTGKATAKTTKANVRNGTCKWADPIYETTRLLQDHRTKHFDQKLYKLVVSMGSSRTSLLGEATINLADYADALKPASVSLPLQGCEAGAILHVTVQLLTSKTGFREFEQQRELRERGLLTNSDHNSRNESLSGRLPSSGDTINDHVENSRVNLRDHPLHEEYVEHNEDHVESSIGFDGSSNTSGSLYADKHDMPSPHEIDSQNSDQKLQPMHGTRDWIHGWGSENSGDNDLAITFEENSRLRGSLDSAESALHEVKLELNSLQSHADELGVEAQKFAQMLAAEMASGENLAREVAILKTECSKFKCEIEVLKDNNSKLRSSCNGRESVGNAEEPVYQDLQLRWLKGLLLVEDKLRVLQNKACFGFNDMDLRLLGSDVETMLIMLKDLKQGTGKVISRLTFATTESVPVMKELVMDSNIHESEEHKSRFGLGTDLYQPESMLHHSVDLNNSMKNRVDELARELESSRAERESLVQKMGQMECYYEALIQELEGNQRHILGELQNLTNEHSACLYAVSSTNSELERTRKDMNDKLILFTEEKQQLDALNKELERRSATAEAALKRARLNYSIAVGQLQKDLELLSSQVSSMYEANQNLIKEAFSEPEGVDHPVGALKSQFCMQKKQKSGGEALLDDLRKSLNSQEELYRKVKDELSDMHNENLYLDIFSKTLRETLHEKKLDMSKKMNGMDELTDQLGLYKKSNDELMLKLQCSLDEVESLQKEKITLSTKFYDMNESNENLGAMLRTMTNENSCLILKITELENLLKKETEESSSLRNGNIDLQEKLMNLTHELHELGSVKETLEALNEEKIALSGRFCEMSKWNEDLEASLLSMTDENDSLMQKIDELENLLKKETEVSGQVRNENAASQEKLMKLTDELHKVESMKENLEKHVSNLQEEMQSLITSYDEKVSRLSEEKESLAKDREMVHASFSTSESAKGDLEKVVNDLQSKMQNTLLSHDVKVSRLLEEVENVTKERDAACAMSSASESAKEHLEKTVSELRQKLHVLVNHHDKTYDWTSLNLFALMSQLGKFQDGAQQKISELSQEIEAVAAERDEARASLCSSESTKENLQKLLQDMEEKLCNLLNIHHAHYDGTCLNLFDVVSEIGEALRTAHQAISDLTAENKVLVNERDDAHASLSSIESEKHKLKNLVSALEDKLCGLVVNFDETVDRSSLDLSNALSLMEEFQQNGSHMISKLKGDNEALVREMESAKLSLNQSEAHFHAVKEEYECDLRDIRLKMNISDDLVQKLQSQLEAISGRLNACLKDEEVYKEKQRGLVADIDRSINEVEQMLLSNKDVDQEILSLQNLGKELEQSKLDVAELAAEKHSLDESLREKTKESAHLVSELTELRASLGCLSEELQRERGCRKSLEETIMNLTSQLNEAHSRLLDFEHQNDELVNLRQLVSDLESEKLRLYNLLSQKEEFIKTASQVSFSAECLEDQLAVMHGQLIDSDIQLTFSRSQYETLVEDSAQQFKLSERSLADLHDKYVDVESRLSNFLENELQLSEENAELSRKLQLLSGELQGAVAENRVLIRNNDALEVELKEYRKRIEDLNGVMSEESRKHRLQIESLMRSLTNAEKDNDNSVISNEEHGVELLVLRGKLHELCSELRSMGNKYEELNERLAAEVLKSAELETLSTQLKELKDKAEAECVKASKKKETDGASFAVQESLRIAFIKEQYESKVQELKQQLSMSKKHSEEMLMKLQDAVDEIEDRKRSEASNLRRNEELSMKILDLESELQEIVSDKREKAKAYDRMKAEMECSLISLECCKEEKQKLEASLQECCEGKSKIEAELLQVKQLLESSKTQLSNSEISPLERGLSMNGDEGDSSSNITSGMHMNQESTSRGENGGESLALINRENFLDSDAKEFVLISDNFKVKGLRSSMDNLTKELEKMKNENWLLPYEDNQFSAKFPELERELVQLDKANEELGSIYPSFNEFGGSSNPLERVLALELELAGALQAKKNSIHFQSSFLRQHGDEAAIFKSFKDINDLIRDMLELKGRYSAVESELKEMHGRYSQLSLQFAEVEGERQKLMMTLKCVRPYKKSLSPHRSSSTSLEENPS